MLDDTFDAGNSTNTPTNSTNWFSGLLDNAGKLAQTGASVYATVKGAPNATQRTAPVVAAQNASVTKYIVIGVVAVVAAIALGWALLRGRNGAATA